MCLLAVALVGRISGFMHLSALHACIIFNHRQSLARLWRSIPVILLTYFTVWLGKINDSLRKYEPGCPGPNVKMVVGRVVDQHEKEQCFHRHEKSTVRHEHEVVGCGFGSGCTYFGKKARYNMSNVVKLVKLGLGTNVRPSTRARCA